MSYLSKYEGFLSNLAQRFSGKAAELGATPLGVGWRNKEQQRLRFNQMFRLLRDAGDGYSLNDLGCGYGALLGYLEGQGQTLVYRGYDIAEGMIVNAREYWKQRGPRSEYKFIVGQRLVPADYSIASGLFNNKSGYPAEIWEEYIFDTLNYIWENSAKGMGFNLPTTYSDYFEEKRYYGDPCRFFDYCKKYYSRNVALLHDYGLYDFTIIVRK